MVFIFIYIDTRINTHKKISKIENYIKYFHREISIEMIICALKKILKKSYKEISMNHYSKVKLYKLITSLNDDYGDQNILLNKRETQVKPFFLYSLKKEKLRKTIKISKMNSLNNMETKFATDENVKFYETMHAKNTNVKSRNHSNCTGLFSICNGLLKIDKLSKGSKYIKRNRRNNTIEIANLNNRLKSFDKEHQDIKEKMEHLKLIRMKIAANINS